MSAENPSEKPLSLPWSEWLRPFSFSGVSKFELQTANDLFERYSSEKDPRILGKLNALRLDVMKRAAEAEIAQLEPKRTRAQIEAEMRERQVSKTQANDELAYVLATYLSHIERLADERRAEVVKVEKATGENVQALKIEVWPSTNALPKEKGGAEGADADGIAKKNAEFIAKNRQKIEALVARLPQGEAKSKIPALLSKPSSDNVREIQTLLGLRGEGALGADGKFWNHTLKTLAKVAWEPVSKPESVSARTVKESPRPSQKEDSEIPAPKKTAGNVGQENPPASSEVERERERIETESREQSERLLSKYQRDAVANLTPLGGDKYVVKTNFWKDRFSAPVLFKFDAENGEWLWNAFNDPDTNKASRGWNRVEGLRPITTNGTTETKSFGFTASAQETVNSILLAQEEARRMELKLKSPSASSGLVDRIPT